MRRISTRRSRTGQAALTLCLALFLGAGDRLLARPKRPEPSAPERARRVQAIVDQFTARLGIPDPIVVDVVAKDPLLVSIGRAPGNRRAFRLSLQADFIDSLADSELRAVVAHELGHVWIFTHHPFLQTEELANRVALRLTDRGDLSRVYEKVWKRTGVEGHLSYLPPDAATRSGAQPK